MLHSTMLTALNSQEVMILGGKGKLPEARQQRSSSD